ncbi:MAG: cytochrome c oxidase subunit II [Hyphomicrobiales bacterium]|nr:MAG: cytochrome c oxidase subunit II [Hyphomicrobiales bacterium]
MAAAGAALAVGLIATTGAMADVVGAPAPWQTSMQAAATPIMERITSFHSYLFWVCVLITLFVTGLLAWCIFRFNEKANPEPSKTTHNTLLEVAWTLVPVLILVAIAIPSFRLLYAQQVIPEADMTIKAIGNQWYWSYEYPDHDDLSFDAVMLQDDELKPGQPRLLATDNEVVVPVGKTIRVIVTASDVLHAWAVPAFGVKVDGVPGRLNETWFRAEKTGIYYGQCSELCGKDHAFMPIAVRVVSEQDFNTWLAKAKVEFGSLDTGRGAIRLASAEVTAR